jgi:hypothetical protein
MEFGLHNCTIIRWMRLRESLHGMAHSVREKKTGLRHRHPGWLALYQKSDDNEYCNNRPGKRVVF